MYGLDEQLSGPNSLVIVSRQFRPQLHKRHDLIKEDFDLALLRTIRELLYLLAESPNFLLPE
jgi:hypothetical protein